MLSTELSNLVPIPLKVAGKYRKGVLRRSPSVEEVLKCIFEGLAANWAVTLFSSGGVQRSNNARSVITLMIWNIPLYANVFFILYMSYLIVKSLSRHKVKLPHIERSN